MAISWDWYDCLPDVLFTFLQKEKKKSHAELCSLRYFFDESLFVYVTYYVMIYILLYADQLVIRDISLRILTYSYPYLST